MKSRHLQGKIGAALLVFSLLSGIALTSVTTVQAQFGRDDQYRRDDQNRRNRRNRRGRDQDGYGNYGGSFQLRQTALNAGFSEGNKEGRKDRQRGEQFEFRDESAYQKATKDYNSRLGDKEIYRRYFREAFEHGYDDGYAGY
jgi:hypothetical protein